MPFEVGGAFKSVRPYPHLYDSQSQNYKDKQQTTQSSSGEIREPMWYSEQVSTLLSLEVVGQHIVWTEPFTFSQHHSSVSYMDLDSLKGFFNYISKSTTTANSETWTNLLCFDVEINLHRHIAVQFGEETLKVVQRFVKAVTELQTRGETSSTQIVV